MGLATPAGNADAGSAGRTKVEVEKLRGSSRTPPPPLSVKASVCHRLIGKV